MVASPEVAASTSFIFSGSSTFAACCSR
jgi:hypothetical protein